ncbi:hypothetical protein BDZ89DRAFT_1065307 [Hymenopellis radicata]|nr:hypothetical protein BDZ89DRAFT_1065307 [Hymenopellis radicata]
MDPPQNGTPTGPRRSQRERKKPQPLETVATTGKRKRAATDDEGDDEEHSGEDNEEEYAAPKRKSPKKPAKKDTAKAPKATTRKPRGRKLQDAAVFDPEQLAKDTKINTDNPLYNAIMNPSAALQGTAEDFLESLEQNEGAAQAELINLILRACGCNDSVDADKALDTDGIQSAVDDLVDALKLESTPTYPLTSKNPMFKKFRTHLSEFLSRVISSAADLGLLYTTDLIPNLSAWVLTMSSAPLRSFRHTATVVALDVEAALCDVTRNVEKEAEVLGRQREGEKKRKAKGGAGAKDKELQTKTKEVKERSSKLNEYLKEFIDGVFINRYRDLDPLIRTECINSLGTFFKKHPSHFLSTSYLRYVGWVLSDADAHVRTAAVKALQVVYMSSVSEHLLTSLNHFTERFKPRLVEMAEADVDVNVRVGVLNVLEAIEKTGMLGEEERERLGALVFCSEPKVRKAVGGFVRGVWEEWVEERDVEMGGKSKEDKDRMGVKGIASLLVKWGKALDEAAGEEDDEEQDSEQKKAKAKTEIASLAAERSKTHGDGRTALATEALWDELEPVRDWSGILDVLLLDHSASAESQAAATGKKGKKARPKGKSRSAATTAVDDEEEDTESVSVDESWRLEEVEEAVLLELLVSSIIKTKKDSIGGKKGEEDAIANDITRALMKGLPRLFVKYQTDENRIKDVLILPTFMNLDLYLEMRAISDYTALWDDILKQFLTHSSPSILALSMSTIIYLLSATSLSNSNSPKILELEDELSSALRDALAERDEIEISTFTEDEVLALSSTCTRIRILAGTRDITAWMEENEGGKQSSAWELITAIAERGRLGYQDEEVMIEQVLHLLTLHIIWKSRGLASVSEEDTQYRETLEAQRSTLLEKLIEFAVGTQSNTVEGVKRSAFKNLLNLHVLFSANQTTAADGTPLPTAAVALSMDDETQYRCAGYIQAEIERYTELIADSDDEDKENATSADDSDSEAPTRNKANNKGKKTAKANKLNKKAQVKEDSRVRLEQEYAFIDVITTFLRAIRAGALQVRHGAVILAHYGLIIDVLREESIMNEEGDIIVLVATQALQEAFTLVIDGVVDDEENAIHLAKQLATCFVIRGAQLTVIRRLDVNFVVQIHSTLLSWLGKRLASYNADKNKNALKRTLSCFRPLTQMLAVVQDREALKIKAHVDQVLAQGKVEVATTVVWEPLRAYERKLMSKDKEHKGERKGKGAATDDESEVERMVEMSHDESEAEAPAAPAPARPRPRRAASNRTRRTPAQTEDEGGDEPATPKAHTDQTPPEAPPANNDPDLEVDVGPQESSHEATPTSSRKRRRPEEEEANDTPDPVPEPLDEPPTPEAGYLQVRRKRARH